MTLKRNAAGVQTDITTTLKRRLSGAWHDLDLIQRRLSGAWTVIYQRIVITAQNIQHAVGAGTARAGYRLNTSGIAEKREGASYTTLETWLTSGTASNYECRVTVSVGSLTSGTTGTWEALSTSRDWLLEQVSVGVNNCTFTVEIRNAASLVVIDSAVITLEAERF